MNMKFYIKRSKFAVINEKPKIWLKCIFLNTEKVQKYVHP